MKYYDHAMNSGPLMGSVIAREQKSAEKAGQVWRVEFNMVSGDRAYWAGGRYTALSLSKSLVANRVNGVTLTMPNGKLVDDIKGARF